MCRFSPTASPRVDSRSPGTTESSWALAGATEKAGDDTGPADPNVHPEAVEGLFEERVLSESRLSAEAFAPVGAGEEARGKGHRVDESEGRVVGDEEKQFLPEALLNLPEVGRLPGEGGPMDLTKGGEPLAIVPLEEEVDTRVGVHPEELSDDLDGEYLDVGELWGGAALTDAASLESVVDEAEDRDDEGAKIHERRPPLRRSVWALPSVGRSSIWIKSSRKLAHGVS